MSNIAAIPFSTTIHVRDHCLCLHAQRAARVLARHFDRLLKPFGLTNNQFSLLMSLNRPQPAPLGSVATLLGLDRTTLTAAVKPLTRNGWIAVSTGKDDRRERYLALTAEGQAVLKAALPVWAEAHAGIDAQLPEGEADRLRQSLNLVSNLQAEGG